jgi:hypothetical protein
LAALLLGGAGLAVGLWSSTDAPRETEQGREQGAVVAPDAENPAEAITTTQDAGVEDLNDAAAPPTIAAPAPARITVLVSPWGSVWINGKPRGAAPLKSAMLKPGRYNVSAGQGSASETRTVRLRAGERKTVRFDLAD